MKGIGESIVGSLIGIGIAIGLFIGMIIYGIYTLSQHIVISWK